MTWANDGSRQVSGRCRPPTPCWHRRWH